MKKDSEFKGLAHISIFCRDLEKSIRFYTENLDFETTYRTVVNPDQEPDGFFPAQYVLIQRGTCLIELLQPYDTGNVKVGIKGSVDHFAIEVKDVERVFTRLKARGLINEADKMAFFPDLFNGMKSFLLRGPSGELVELLEYL
ncbi:MAG TPA: VOC family protein [Acidobacteriota bacterium]|nr:VOC family protein [Acidobacteriota bacterium]